MSITTSKSPAINTWLDLVPARNLWKYLNIINMDSANPCNVAVALMNTSLPALEVPANGGAIAMGVAGSHVYNYRVTAANENGETAPCDVFSITDGPDYSQLKVDVNFHSLSWDAVAGATKYYVYCDVNGRLRVGKEVTASSAVNDGSWDLFPKWPWMNTEQLLTFFMYEALPKNGIIQRYGEEEVPSGHKVVIAVDNVMANFYARYQGL